MDVNLGIKGPNNTFRHFSIIAIEFVSLDVGHGRSKYRYIDINMKMKIT